VILDALAQSGFPCLVFTPHPLPIANIPRHLKISHDMLDLGIIAKQADLAIAVSITTASHFLLRGKPVLCAPTQLEQYLHARAVVEELRAGMMLLPDAPVSSQQIISALHSMYHHPSFAQNARNFRQRNPNPYNGLKRYIKTCACTHRLSIQCDWHGPFDCLLFLVALWAYQPVLPKLI
jgi:UDP:flavonoid glycosyltransferase YjiC (YdhE family)